MVDKPGTIYDAFLLISFGGPEGMNDVIPFLENVLRGKNVPASRMLDVSKHYALFDGISPINEENRKLISALKPVIETSGPKLPIYWGNRNWHPLLPDTIQQMAADRVKRAIAFVTAGYSSYSSCRQYIENIENACKPLGLAVPQIDKIRPFYNHPSFIAANAQELNIALNQIPIEQRKDALIIFTAHSIPMSMANVCRYEKQLQETCNLVMSEAGLLNSWELAYQSRSGPPNQAWLEPDIANVIEKAKKASKRNIVIAPIGFVADHMEVLYDLDTQAKELCENLHINYRRAKTAQNRPEFIFMIKQLVEEKIAEQNENLNNSTSEYCYTGCCPIG